MSAARTVAGVPDDPSALLLDTFVELADTLATGYEVGDFLQFLVDRCSGLLLADTAGVLLETPEGTLALAAATSPEMLEDLEVSLGQGPGSWQERAVFAAERRSEQMQRALNSRITIEQAKGILAERHGLRPGEAFTVLPTHARSRNLNLREVCQRFVDGQLEL